MPKEVLEHAWEIMPMKQGFWRLTNDIEILP